MLPVVSVITSALLRTFLPVGRRRLAVSGGRLVLGPFKRVFAFTLRGVKVMAHGLLIDA